jgi:hypothetical protein
MAVSQQLSWSGRLMRTAPLFLWILSPFSQGLNVTAGNLA